MAAHQASPSLGFSRQEHWNGLPFPSPVHESEKWKWSRSVVSDSRDPMDCSSPGSSVHGILQARVLEWGAIGINKDIIQICGGIGSHSISLLVITSSLWRPTGKWDSEADFLKGWMHLWPNTVCRTWSCHSKWYLAKYSLAVAYLKHGIWFLLQLNEGEVYQWLLLLLLLSRFSRVQLCATP